MGGEGDIPGGKANTDPVTELFGLPTHMLVWGIWGWCSDWCSWAALLSLGPICSCCSCVCASKWGWGIEEAACVKGFQIETESSEEAGGGWGCWFAECDGETEGGERGAVRGDTSGVVNSHTRPFATEVWDPHVRRGANLAACPLFAPAEL